MRRRWTGRRAGFAAAAVLALGVVIAGATAVGAGLGRIGPAVTVRDTEGTLLARVPLTDGRFALRYRNSLYGSLAEERFVATEDGRFRLVELAADQLPVLEEYYAVPGPPRRAPASDRRTWLAEPHPDRPVVLSELTLAASDLGERTLFVPSTPPLALWRLVDDNPTVVLDIERAP